MIKINEKAPEFTENAFVNNEIKKINLSDYKGKWVVLFFYPADFTFVCPTELGELADKYPKIQELGAEIISVSTDTAFVHKAWQDHSPTIQKIKFPMLADPAMRVTNSYGTLIEEEGLSLRATIIIDPEGIIKAFEFHDNSIGRSADELIRKIEAAKFVAEHDGMVCPASWKPGKETLKPGLDLVGKI
ncbi:redoxin domain-containing protein [Candidatus Woesearchaeota archaeon]|nr:redoxin domain-containing protein [Candidatus Woesearchaeota archaeon]MBT6519833.1 redoxin domain-containing protein [Candidatus Woesearchaeota archaeon]